VLLAAGFAAAIYRPKIDRTPPAERQEIRDIYAAKGFAGDLLAFIRMAEGRAPAAGSR
jgi:hypothetical protein